MTTGLPQLLRSDAEDNRLRILEAARQVFAEQGLTVSMREIARRANVGPATLYRRFPTKHDLIREAFTDELETCRAIALQGCADPDAWRGLRSVITRIVDLGARNSGFTDAFLSAFPDSVDFAAHRTAIVRDLAELCARAKASGQLRADFVLDDLILIILAGRGIATGSIQMRIAAAHRFAALAIDALSATSERSVLPPPARVATAVLQDSRRGGTHD